MNWFKDSILMLIGTLGSFITALYGGWNAALSTLVIFMIIDYLTGLVVAGVFKKSGKTKNGMLKSQVGFLGLCKKGVALAIVIVAYRIDVTIGSDFVKDAVIIAFIANETISIIENAGLMGIPIPSVLMRAIEVLQKKGEEK